MSAEPVTAKAYKSDAGEYIAMCSGRTEADKIGYQLSEANGQVTVQNAFGTIVTRAVPGIETDAYFCLNNSDGNMADEVYARIGGEFYAFDLSEAYGVPASNAWKSLSSMSVPYDSGTLDFAMATFDRNATCSNGPVLDRELCHSGARTGDVVIKAGPYPYNAAVMENHTLLARHGGAATVGGRIHYYDEFNAQDASFWSEYLLCAWRASDAQPTVQEQIRALAWEIRRRIDTTP